MDRERFNEMIKTQLAEAEAENDNITWVDVMSIVIIIIFTVACCAIVTAVFIGLLDQLS